MRIENLAVPDGCQVAVVEQVKFEASSHNLTTMTAACGSRIVQSMYQPTAFDKPEGTPAYDDAVQEARDDLSILVGAMCIDCPNRIRSEAEQVAEPESNESATGVSADESEDDTSANAPQEGELTRTQATSDETSTNADAETDPVVIEANAPLAIDGAAATNGDD